MSETPEEKAEARAVRRRWITLGELLAVAAVLISALTLYNSWSERRDQRALRESEIAEKKQADAREKAVKRAYVVKGRVIEDGDALELSPLSDPAALQDVTIGFPTALNIAAIEGATDARLPARALADELRATRPAKRGRVPVTITARYYADGALAEDAAVYDAGYVLEDRLIGPAAVKLTGLSLVARASPADAARRRDRLWASRQPTISSSEKK